MDSNKTIKDLQALKSHRRMMIWQPFMEKYHCDNICEVGIRTGVHFGRMIAHKPKLAIAVDSWLDDVIISRNDRGFSQNELDRQHENFKKDMADKPFVKVCKGYSFDVVKEFPDEFFDFVFIDADHTFEGCLRDIVDWYPKVKKGKVLCGHDYILRRYKNKHGEIVFGVVEAVNKFVKDNNITTFFTLPYNIWVIIK